MANINVGKNRICDIRGCVKGIDGFKLNESSPKNNEQQHKNTLSFDLRKLFSISL